MSKIRKIISEINNPINEDPVYCLEQFEEKRNEIKKRLLEISVLLEEMAKYSIQTLPSSLYKECDLPPKYSTFWDEEGELEARYKWASIIKKISFLLSEITTGKFDVLSSQKKFYNQRIIELNKKLNQIKDENSEEYKKLSKEESAAYRNEQNVRFALDTYKIACLNELTELMKKYWWNLIFKDKVVNDVDTYYYWT